MGTMTAAQSRAVDRVYSAFGDAATYTNSLGQDTPCVVLVESNLTPYGDTLQINARTAVLSVRAAQISEAPRRGDTIEITGGRLYKIDSLQATTDLEHKMVAA